MHWVFYITATLVGLLAGSFLNVVIHRGPAMWGLVDDEIGARGALWAPRSYCPSCKKQIGVFDLAPLASYALLRGKCRACGGAISPRYPAVELAGALAALGALLIYGLSASALFAAVYLWALIALAAIDAETGFLPDAITFPLIALGLIANLGNRFVPLDAAVIGAVAGYIVFWIVSAAYRRIRRREGLGGGDAKLLAAIGAWAGWMAIAPAILIGALLSLAGILGLMMLGKKIGPETPVPFGPSLCLGGAITFLAGGVGGLPLIP